MLNISYFFHYFKRLRSHSAGELKIILNPRIQDYEKMKEIQCIRRPHMYKDVPVRRPGY